MERDRLSGLIHATVDPSVGVSAHTIPRALIDRNDPERKARVATAPESRESISPVAVLFVVAMLATVFVAILRM